MKTTLLKIGAMLALLIVATFIHAVVADIPVATAFNSWAKLISIGTLAMSFSGGPSVRDANQKLTLALPNAANTTVNTTTSLDTMAGSHADFTAMAELLVTAPALNTTQLPNSATMTYNVIASANSNMAGATVIQPNAIIQTGAGGAGTNNAGSTARVRLPTNIAATGRYIGLQAVGAVSNGNCAAASGTLEMLF